MRSVADGIDYLSWTFFFRRLLVNPSYYGVASAEPKVISKYLTELVKQTVADLREAGCVGDAVDDQGGPPATSSAALVL